MTALTTPARPARVLIVDDSRSIRGWLRHVLEQDPRLEVAGEAADSTAARDLVRTDRFDVMTLDVDMPGMSGLDFLARLMARRPLPVVMMSAYTDKGSTAALEALSLGAVDCIAKPRTQPGPEQLAMICQTVWDAAQTRVQRSTARQAPAAPLTPALARGQRRDWTGQIVLCGASTGGVAAIEALLREIDHVPSPIVIAQHMPEMFLRSFTRRLNEQFGRNFVLAEDGLVLKEGMGVLALGKNVSTRLEHVSGGRLRCALGPPSDGAIYRPNVNDLFLSGAAVGCVAAAALLTGMGDDGARGLSALRAAGSVTYAQSEESCVVYGMPRRAVELDAAMTVGAPDRIGREIAALDAVANGTARRMARS